MGKPKQTHLLPPHLASHGGKGSQLPTDALLAARPRTRGTGILEPKNEAQRIAIATIGANQLTFIEGPAGTGKTHIEAAMAGLALKAGDVERVIVTRPNIEAGTPMGFMPGTMQEKFDPYFKPVRRILEKVLGAGYVEYATKGDFPIIEIAPVPFLRGSTFENAFVILDEAQNMTPREMQMFLTRIDDYSTVVVDGDPDPSQRDITGPCGLTDAIARMKDIKGVGHVRFTEADIVRGGLCRETIIAYRRKIPANDPVSFDLPGFLTRSAA